MKEKYFIGLTGGVGSGKSRILELLGQVPGVRAIKTDAVAKELEEPGQPGFAALVDAFGPEIVGQDGRLKKEELARLVFGDGKAREKVNNLLHPLVWEYVGQQAKQEGFSILVAESALLLENPDDFFDEIWYVYTAREKRIQRLIEGRGYSRQKCCQMMACQPAEEAYGRHADVVIDNNGPVEAVRQQVYKRLQLCFAKKPHGNPAAGVPKDGKGKKRL